MRCDYCRYEQPRHDPDCPEQVPANMSDWERGNSAGRAGRPHEVAPTKAYSLGHIRGTVALEEAENGSPPY